MTFLDGTAVLGTSTLDAAGRATLTTSSLPLGTHAITAEYAGDPGDAGKARASAA